jgi:hypothetical protein
VRVGRRFKAARPVTCRSPPRAAQAGRNEEPNSPEEVFGAGAAATYQIPYVLIGGGTACHFAMKAILEKDPTAKVHQACCERTMLLATSCSPMWASFAVFPPPRPESHLQRRL